MIKVGDYVKLKKGIHSGTRRELTSEHNFPLKVYTITKCDGDMKGCKECPGYINKERICFGYHGFYVAKAIPYDWDE